MNEEVAGVRVRGGLLVGEPCSQGATTVLFQNGVQPAVELWYVRAELRSREVPSASTSRLRPAGPRAYEGRT